MCTSKGFAKFENYNTGVDNNFPFKRLNALCYSSFHLNEPLSRIFNSSVKDLQKWDELGILGFY